VNKGASDAGREQKKPSDHAESRKESKRSTESTPKPIATHINIKSANPGKGGAAKEQKRESVATATNEKESKQSTEANPEPIATQFNTKSVNPGKSDTTKGQKKESNATALNENDGKPTTEAPGTPLTSSIVNNNTDWRIPKRSIDYEVQKTRRQEERQKHQQSKRQQLLDRLRKRNQTDAENQELFDNLEKVEKDMRDTHNEGASTLESVGANSKGEEW